MARGNGRDPRSGSARQVPPQPDFFAYPGRRLLHCDRRRSGPLQPSRRNSASSWTFRARVAGKTRPRRSRLRRFRRGRRLV